MHGLCILGDSGAQYYSIQLILDIGKSSTCYFVQ